VVKERPDAANPQADPLVSGAHRGLWLHLNRLADLAIGLYA
jgi:hypothetical protein